MNSESPAQASRQQDRVHKDASRLAWPEMDLENIKSPSHFVQFFREDSHLVRSVSAFVGAGLGAGHPAIVIATQDHREAIDAELKGNGIDVAGLVASGRYIVLDAKETLNSFMSGDLPDQDLFDKHVGSLVGRVASPERAPRLFGEMVALLCQEGKGEAALKLEQLWNRLAAKHRFSLFCAYQMKDLGSVEETGLFERICGEHSEVIPAESYSSRLTGTDQRREIAALQQKAESLETEIKRRQRIEDEIATFVETAHMAMHWVGPDGIIQWANAAEMNLLGYSPDEYIGRNISEFHVDQDVIDDILARLSRDEQLCDYQARLKCKDGNIKTVEISSSVLWKDGQFLHTQCFTRDITAQLEAERAARHLAAIVETADDAIISKDLDGIITSWNKGAERIFGWSEEEAVGEPIYMLIPSGRHNEEPEILRRIRRGEVVDHYETVRQRKDGTLLEISVTISPIRDSKGVVVGASKIARDITRQKRILRELESLTAELVKAKSELEQRVDERTASLRNAVAQMEEFSYTVSHDLRAPLRAMNMYSNVLLEEFSPLLKDHPDAIHYLNRIASNCSRLDHMIQDVLTFGRVTREGITLEPVSLDRLTHELIQHYPALQAPNAHIEITPLGEVVGHEPSLAQVISNLLINAVKFVPANTLPKIRVYSERENGTVKLWVADNGIGIDPKYQHRLFGLFERIHPDLNYEGTGVGLAIVRKATSRMGGSVGVESDGVNGSRFWVELPAAKVEVAQ